MSVTECPAPNTMPERHVARVAQIVGALLSVRAAPVYVLQLPSSLLDPPAEPEIIPPRISSQPHGGHDPAYFHPERPEPVQLQRELANGKRITLKQAALLLKVHCQVLHAERTLVNWIRFGKWTEQGLIFLEGVRLTIPRRTRLQWVTSSSAVVRFKRALAKAGAL